MIRPARREVETREPGEEEEPEPEIVLRSEHVALERDRSEPQFLCIPTRTLEDCEQLTMHPKRGSVSAPKGFAASVLPAVEQPVAETAFELYTVTETALLDQWEHRFCRYPEHDWEPRLRDGDRYICRRHDQGEDARRYRIDLGRAFVDLRMWLVYPNPERGANSTRLALGPFDPPLTVCFPFPRNERRGVLLLAGWENEHLPWPERRWTILDGAPSDDPFQSCAVTRFGTLFVFVRHDDPLAGLSEIRYKRSVYWRAVLPIAASELMAALPPSDSYSVIHAVVGGEAHHYVRDPDGQPVVGFSDFQIEPGQEITLFR